MMNFVVFGLGGRSARPGMRGLFAAAEMARLRTRTLAMQSLIAASAAGGGQAGRQLRGAAEHEELL